MCRTFLASSAVEVGQITLKPGKINKKLKFGTVSCPEPPKTNSNVLNLELPLFLPLMSTM